MKKIILIILCMILLTTGVNAIIDLGTVKQGECIELYQSCPTCTYSDVRAIKYPNGTIDDSIDWTMDKDNSDFTYNFCETDFLGECNYFVYGNKGGLSYESSEEGIFKVTPTGKSFNTSSAIVSVFILFLMFGVTIFFLIFAGIAETAGIKLFFNIISYLTMFLTIGSGYILLQSSEVQSNLSGTMEALIFILGIVLIIIMFFIFINQTRQALELMRAKKGFGSEFDNPPTF